MKSYSGYEIDILALNENIIKVLLMEYNGITLEKRRGDQ